MRQMEGPRREPGGLWIGRSWEGLGLKGVGRALDQRERGGLGGSWEGLGGSWEGLGECWEGLFTLLVLSSLHPDGGR